MNSAIHQPFDPYHKWLGISAREQPPNHYRLLSIELFEDDADVIANAADQRMAHLRTFQIGKHSALSQQLLNEVAAARLCLLHPERRRAYDQELRRKLQPEAIPHLQQAVTPPPIPPLAQAPLPETKTGNENGSERLTKSP